MPRARVRPNLGGGAGTNRGSNLLSRLPDTGGIPDRSGRGDGVRYNSSKGQVVTSGIYIILNTANGKCYVGSSIDVYRRLHGHRKTLERGNHCNCHLQSAWNTYGSSTFEFKVVALCSEVRLVDEEQKIMDGFQSRRPEKGYNYREAGNRGRHSPETKAKIRASQTGRKHGLEMRTKISAAKHGQKYTPETCARMSMAHVGHKPTVETRAKLSASKVGNRNALGSHKKRR